MVVTGELDIDNVDALEAALHDAGTQDTTPVVIDLSGVTFADSTTVNVILHGRSQLDSRLRLAAPSPFMERLIGVIGLDGAMPVYATVDEAVSATPSVTPGPHGSE